MHEYLSIGRMNQWLGTSIVLLFSLSLQSAEATSDSEASPPGLTRWLDATGEKVPATAELLERGAQLYEIRCHVCHGAKGDGKGPAARLMPTKPRDFTKAIFKYATTDRAGLPADEDFYRTISVGFPAYGMPSFRYLSNEDRWSLVYYTKSLVAAGIEDRLRREFAEEGEEFDAEYARQVITSKTKEGKPVSIPAEPAGVAAGVLTKGPVLYKKYQCDACHGEKGHGDGPSVAQLKDDWGAPVSPRDLREPRVFRKGGWQLEDTARITLLGIPGATMPSFVAAMTPAELWTLARYTEYLREGKEPAE